MASPESSRPSGSPGTMPSPVGVDRRRPRSLTVDLSPKLLTATEAIQTKLSRRDGYALRRVHPQELSVRQAEELVGSGSELLLSPKGTYSNLTMQGMRETLNAIGNVDLAELREIIEESRISKLYTRFVGMGWQSCEYDLIVMVMDTLDFLCEKFFNEDFRSHNLHLTPDPFFEPQRNGCRYFHLSEFVQSGRATTRRQANLAQDLLCRVETSLLNAVSAHEHGLEQTEDDCIKKDVSEFSCGSHLREGRHFSAHVFSSMLVQINNDFSVELPRVKPIVFNFQRPNMLKFMALRALVLQDLKDRLDKNCLVENTPFLHKIGLLLAQKFMSIHIPFSLKVSYGALDAIVLKDGEGVEHITIEHIYTLRGVGAPDGEVSLITAAAH